MTPLRSFCRKTTARTRRWLDALSLAAAILLAGCRAPGLQVTGIAIAKDATFDLMSPASLKQSISLEQIVEAKYGDKSYKFHCLLEVDEKHLVLVGMTPFNTRAFTLTLTVEAFTIDMAPGAQLPAEPSRILADLQLALWPESKVHGLDSVWHQSVRGTGVREFRRHGVGVIFIGYDMDVTGPHEEPWGGRLVFQHIEQNYTLDVRTIRAEKLAP